MNLYLYVFTILGAFIIGRWSMTPRSPRPPISNRLRHEILKREESAPLN